MFKGSAAVFNMSLMFWKKKVLTPAIALPEMQTGADEFLIDFTEDYTELHAETYSQYIEILRNTVGYSRKNFDNFFIKPVHNLINYCYGLPATRAEHHCFKHGLIKHALDTALYATRSADGSFFSAQVPEEFREQSEIRWRYAAFLGGLCCDLKNTRKIVLAHGPQQWNPLLEGTVQWAKASSLAAWPYEWNPEVEEAEDFFSVIYARNVIPKESLEFLTTFNHNILDVLLRVLAGRLQGHEHTLAELVENARDTSISKDIAMRAASGMDGSFHTANSDVLLLDVLRRLMKSEWTFNNPGSVAWYTDQGLFLVWARAAKDMVGMFTEDHVYTIPREPYTLAEFMLKNALIEAGPKCDVFWELTPPGKNKMVLEAVKVSDADALFAVLKDRPVALSLEAEKPEPELQDIKPPVPEKPAAKVPTQTEIFEHKPLAQAQAETSSAQARTPGDRSEPPTEAWFIQQGKLGAVLKSIRDELDAKVLQAGKDVFWDNNGLAIIYPDIIQSYGVDPQLIVKEMSQKEWLDKDPKQPTASLRVIGSGESRRRVVVLKKEIGNHVLAAH